jgi:hypothetical protein
MEDTPRIPSLADFIAARRKEVVISAIVIALSPAVTGNFRPTMPLDKHDFSGFPHGVGAGTIGTAAVAHALYDVRDQPRPDLHDGRGQIIQSGAIVLTPALERWLESRDA